MSSLRCDVLIVGLGHAGCEAALAAARMGLNVIAVTLNRQRSAVMSCNPAIGGTAKGHLVKELDALGGQMARAADEAGTHFITLNLSKGPAVRATRVLCDRDAYAVVMQKQLDCTPGLSLVEGEVAALVTEGGRAVGARLADGREIVTPAVVVTTGTFLQALMHVGAQKEVGGRLGDAAATGLSGSLRELGFVLGRFKTGTPARLRKSSIDFSRCQKQPGDAHPRPFSRWTPLKGFPQKAPVDCYLTFTNEATHRILRDNLKFSPLYQGEIVGRGPRYCPSVEDKVVRFADKVRHTVFLEPEGPQSDLVYPAGLSTSLPAAAQLAFLRSIVGLEDVQVERFGYAVEYDYSPPTQLKPTLETQRVEGLYFAGQLNGTSGYEEAAVQGLLAGINAALKVKGAPPLVLGRHEAHAAVLVDDLVTKGVDEPFRMFTSRSEHRLKLREGNAAFRLSGHGFRVGLLDGPRWNQVVRERESVSAEVARLANVGLLSKLKRPEVTYAALAGEDAERPVLPVAVTDEVETEVKYAGYIAQAEEMASRHADAHEHWSIPHDIVWSSVRGLSAEVQERLQKSKPSTVAQAKRLPGMTPAAVSLLLIHLKRTVIEKV
ncbi:MAG: tRNA uridine-5-carboxymethylaminomethyl(34) synthesis enzyme MnmG [Myxococcaceae bacterium]|nr:tRNA uridine-5-carboxymethylaminomethyl(34) synthesis enzyme MnmG [Myxococcaceae bacterium]